MKEEGKPERRRKTDLRFTAGPLPLFLISECAKKAVRSGEGSREETLRVRENERRTGVPPLAVADADAGGAAVASLSVLSSLAPAFLGRPNELTGSDVNWE